MRRLPANLLPSIREGLSGEKCNTNADCKFGRPCVSSDVQLCVIESSEDCECSPYSLISCSEDGDDGKCLKKCESGADCEERVPSIVTAPDQFAFLCVQMPMIVQVRTRSVPDEKILMKMKRHAY